MGIRRLAHRVGVAPSAQHTRSTAPLPLLCTHSCSAHSCAHATVPERCAGGGNKGGGEGEAGACPPAAAHSPRPGLLFFLLLQASSLLPSPAHCHVPAAAHSPRPGLLQPSSLPRTCCCALRSRRPAEESKGRCCLLWWAFLVLTLKREAQSARPTPTPSGPQIPPAFSCRSKQWACPLAALQHVTMRWHGGGCCCP